MTYDVAIAGLGGIGSAIAAQCAARGASVIGLEQFGPAHDRGASHGRTRMIRQAYFEDAAYVPLVLRSYELWRKLEEESGETPDPPTAQHPAEHKCSYFGDNEGKKPSSSC